MEDREMSLFAKFHDSNMNVKKCVHLSRNSITYYSMSLIHKHRVGSSHNIVVVNERMIKNVKHLFVLHVKQNKRKEKKTRNLHYTEDQIIKYNSVLLLDLQIRYCT